MANETIIRFISIGASLFIILLTMTSVMSYYNTARSSISNIGVTNLANNYNSNIQGLLYEKEVTGSDVKNMLQYFFENESVHINLDSFYIFNNNTNNR